ncbi:MAG: hypothetical protein QM387_00410 [Spirochaetota bacterium]|nr:hypothetical protein [Spirochaetota bacterium]HQC27054.1 hypothetical protein [Treponemataceae bacterium]
MEPIRNALFMPLLEQLQDSTLQAVHYPLELKKTKAIKMIA